VDNLVVSWSSLAGIATVLALVFGALTTYMRLSVLSEVDHRLDKRQREWQEFITRLEGRMAGLVRDLARSVANRDVLDEKFKHINTRFDLIDKRHMPAIDRINDIAREVDKISQALKS